MTEQSNPQEEKQKNFTCTPNMLFASYKHLTIEEKYLWQNLKRIYWDGKPRYMGLREWGDATGYSTGALSKMLPRLHTCKLIEAVIEKEDGKGNRKYKITVLDISDLNKKYYSCSPNERDLLDPSLELVHQTRQACSPNKTSLFTKQDKPVHQTRQENAVDSPVENDDSTSKDLLKDGLNISSKIEESNKSRTSQQQAESLTHSPSSTEVSFSQEETQGGVTTSPASVKGVPNSPNPVGDRVLETTVQLQSQIASQTNLAQRSLPPDSDASSGIDAPMNVLNTLPQAVLPNDTSTHVEQLPIVTLPYTTAQHTSIQVSAQESAGRLYENGTMHVDAAKEAESAPQMTQHPNNTAKVTQVALFAGETSPTMEIKASTMDVAASNGKKAPKTRGGNKGAKKSENEAIVTKSPPQLPDASMPWGTRKCIMLFDAWRGATLISKYELMQASSQAKGLAEQYTEEQVSYIYKRMNATPYWKERGGADIGNVARNIHKEIKKIPTPAVSTPAVPGLSQEDAEALAIQALNMAKTQDHEIQVSPMPLKNGSWCIVVDWNTPYVNPMKLKSNERWSTAFREVCTIWKENSRKVPVHG